MEEIYQIKVTLLHTDPPVWRRVLMPADLTLAELHNVLQAIMNWQNAHLRQFQIKGREIRMLDLRDPLARGGGRLSEPKLRLCDLLWKPRAKMEYLYDFGDNWQHGIVLEKIVPAESGVEYPTCTGGERNGPPEDCGGPFGYKDFVEAIRNPAHEEHENLMEWLGGGFDPEAFSIDAVNRKLARLQKRIAKRRAKAPA